MVKDSEKKFKQSIQWIVHPSRITNIIDNEKKVMKEISLMEARRCGEVKVGECGNIVSVIDPASHETK